MQSYDNMQMKYFRMEKTPKKLTPPPKKKERKKTKSKNLGTSDLTLDPLQF